MTGQRRVDPFAARYLLDRGRFKQAKVSGQKQEYRRQGRDVNNTRQKSGSQAQVQSSEFQGRVVRGSNTEITTSRMGNTQKCQPGQEQDFTVSAWKCAAYMCMCE